MVEQHSQGGFHMKNGEYILVKAPKNYKGKLYRGKYCYEHHLVYWQNTGHIVQDTEIIHHKDGNKQNNSFDNLELRNYRQHIILHNKERKTTFVLLKCPGCGKVFTRRKKNSFLAKGGIVSCCSKMCIGKFTGLTGIKRETAIKENFIKEFKA